MTIVHRAATVADRRFVISTWSASYKKSHSAGIIQADDWARINHGSTCACGVRTPGQLEQILDRDGMRVVLAVDEEDTDYFYGWIAGDTSQSEPLVAYVYTKEPHRKQGIARGLFAALGIDPLKRFTYACKTGIVSELASKIPFAEFNNNDIRYLKRGQ